MKRLWLGLFAVAAAAVAFATSTTTTNFTLTKPGVGDTGWGAAVNTNLDVLDRMGATLDTNGLLRAAVVKSSHVATNEIAGSNLQANCVKSSHVADGTLLGADLSATAGITGGQLAANTITGSNMSNAIKSTHVVDGSLDGIDLNSNCVKSSHVVDGSLDGIDLNSNCVKSSHVVDGSLTGLDLAAQTVSGNNLEAGCVTSSAIVVVMSTTSFHEGYNTGSRMTNSDTTGSTRTASALSWGGLGPAATPVDDLVTLAVPTGVTKVMVSMSASPSFGTNFGNAFLYVDGVIHPDMRIISSLSYTAFQSVVGMVTVTANATHTFEIRYQRDAGAGGNMIIDARRLQVWLVGN